MIRMCDASRGSHRGDVLPARDRDRARRRGVRRVKGRRARARARARSGGRSLPREGERHCARHDRYAHGPPRSSGREGSRAPDGLDGGDASAQSSRSSPKRWRTRRSFSRRPSRSSSPARSSPSTVGSWRAAVRPAAQLQQLMRVIARENHPLRCHARPTSPTSTVRSAPRWSATA